MSLPPIGDAFMYTETGGKTYGQRVFVGFEGTDIIQIKTISFYYNRYSGQSNIL